MEGPRLLGVGAGSHTKKLICFDETLSDARDGWRHQWGANKKPAPIGKGAGSCV